MTDSPIGDEGAESFPGITQHWHERGDLEQFTMSDIYMKKSRMNIQGWKKSFLLSFKCLKTALFLKNVVHFLAEVSCKLYDL